VGRLVKWETGLVLLRGKVTVRRIAERAGPTNRYKRALKIRKGNPDGEKRKDGKVCRNNVTEKKRLEDHPRAFEGGREKESQVKSKRGTDTIGGKVPLIKRREKEEVNGNDLGRMWEGNPKGETP